MLPSCGTDAAKQAKIMEAEAEKTAKILAAEAESEAIMKVQQATADALKLLNEAAPNDQVVKLKALETMTKVADGKATKIIIPANCRAWRVGGQRQDRVRVRRTQGINSEAKQSRGFWATGLLLSKLTLSNL